MLTKLTERTIAKAMRIKSNFSHAKALSLECEVNELFFSRKKLGTSFLEAEVSEAPEA